MRFALAVLLVLAVAGTASATEYLWFELIGGNATVVNQGPGKILTLSAAPGSTVSIGAFMTDDGEGLRGYGFDLYTSEALTCTNPAAGLISQWTSVSAEVGSAGPGTIVELGAFTAGTYPTLGSETSGAPMIASFDLIIGEPGWSIGGCFNTEVTHGTSAHRWGAYYNEAYVGATYFPAGQAYSGIGHYAGYDFGTVIRCPEPATLALLGLGIVAILRRR